MYRFLIVADDLTGANASGVALSKHGLRAATVLDGESMPASLDGYDVVARPTDSRALDPGEAYARVKAATARFAHGAVVLYTKRIDSTLRGNVGREIDAMLDALAEIEGRERVAIVVPAYPSAGRAAIGGYLLVNGVPLERSDAGKDPKRPVASSRTDEIVAIGTRRSMARLGLDDILAGHERIAERLRAYAAAGIRIVVADALSTEDIDAIAEGALSSGVSFIASDPGPFTAALATRLSAGSGFDGGSDASRVLVLVGSVASGAAEQIEEFFRVYDVPRAVADAGLLAAGGTDRDREVARIIARIVGSDRASPFACVVTNGIDPGCVLNLEAEARRLRLDAEGVSGRINEALAEAADRVMELDASFKAIYLSGGDTTIAMCRRLGATGLELIQEVMPLAAFGRLVGGRRPGLPVVTKGGMAGDKNALKDCVRFLAERLNAGV